MFKIFSTYICRLAVRYDH